MTISKRNSLLLFAIPFIATIMAYLKTVCPTVYSGDSGELALACSVLGIAHPPGYPLLTLFGRAFVILLPINPAHALNILSAFFASAATGVGAVVFRHILYVGDDRESLPAVVISIIAAILFGFSNSLWATAVGFEVYSLGALFFMLSLLCLCCFLDTNKQGSLVGSAYFLFLGLTNHLSIAVMFIPIAYMLITRRVTFKTWLILGGLFLLAISAYLFIPVRSSLNPIADWNHPANFKAFYEHITAKRYHEYVTGIRLDNYLENLWRSIMILADQFPFYLALPGLLAILLPGVISKKYRIILIFIVLFNLLVAALYDIPDIDQYYLPTLFVSVAGFVSLLIWLSNKITRAKAVAIGAVAAVLLLTLFRNYPQNNQSENRLAFIYGMDIFNSVPQNSILVSVGDNANSSIYYLHYVEGLRPDLEIYDIVKTVRKLRARLHETGEPGPSGTELCMKLMSMNPDRSYLVKEHLMIRGLAFDYFDMNITPHGLVYRWGKWSQDITIWNRLELPVLSSFSSKMEFRGLTMLCNLNLSRGEDLLTAGDTLRAQSDFLTAADIADYSGEASIHNSLGVFFRHLRQSKFAESEYSKALKSWHLTAFERSNIYVNLGNLRKDKGGYDQAIDLYNKAIAINNENSAAKYNLALAVAYQNAFQGHYLDAINSFESALQYPGADSILIYNIAALYDFNLADTMKAISTYRRFIELLPNLPQSEKARQRIHELGG